MVSWYAFVSGCPVTQAASGPPKTAITISRTITAAPNRAALSSRKRSQKRREAERVTVKVAPPGLSRSVAAVTAESMTLRHSRC